MIEQAFLDKEKELKNSEDCLSKIQDIIHTLEEIFNYKKFTDINPTHKWNAYELTKSLQMNVCPYCNRNYTMTLDVATGRTRPQLYHFYNKSCYPFLAVSFFNLIPSCYVCNSNLKRDLNFTNATHLNPYEHGFDDEIQFSVKFNHKTENIDYISAWYGNTDVFDIIIKFNEFQKPRLKKAVKAMRNINAFNLEEIYNLHKDYVSEILIKAIVYNSDKIDLLLSDFPELFSTREDVIRLLTSNYISPEDVSKRVLSKLTRDICMEFKILT
jgi:hypothetical protein